MRRRRVWVLVVVVVLAWAPLAAAEDRSRARELYRTGSQHYKLGEFPQALDAFKEAYRNFEDPKLLFNIAQCQRQMNLKREAIRSYKTYLTDLPDAPNRAEVQRMLASLEEAARREEAAAADKPRPEAPPPATTAPPEPAAVDSAPAAATTPAPALTARAPADTAGRTPLYKKWWLWTIVGAVAAGGVAVALGVTLAPGPSAPDTMTTNGTIHPF